MSRYCVLLLFFYSIAARCPAPYPGEHGPCMKTCGTQKRCSPGLWCCVTPCGGTVCKIPDLANQATNNQLHKKETPLNGPPAPILTQVQNRPHLQQHQVIPPTHRHNTPGGQEQLQRQGHQNQQIHNPPASHILPNTLQHSPVFEETLMSLLQPDVLTYLDPMLDPLSNPGSGISVLNHETNIVRQEFNHFQSPVNNPVPQIETGCPPGKPKVFCGYDPCSGKTCPVFAGSICVPDYCGDCRFKFTLATVDVTQQCHFNFNR